MSGCNARYLATKIGQQNYIPETHPWQWTFVPTFVPNMELSRSSTILFLEHFSQWCIVAMATSRAHDDGATLFG
jgi:hypothetical protein